MYAQVKRPRTWRCGRWRKWRRAAAGAACVFAAVCPGLLQIHCPGPIVRLSGIAGKLAELDLGWTCEETRQDEIGQLGQCLNQMAQKLSAALQELKASNEALRGEVEQERELERQRTAFFSAASHELKTPVTILKGQLSGMLDGVGVYRDRETYLARSLQVTARMEALIQEILTVSRMEALNGAALCGEVDLSEAVERQLALVAELLGQRNLKVKAELCPELTVRGDWRMLEKAIGNLLANAALYSPEGGEICVWCGRRQGKAALTIENTDVWIKAEALPHLFEPFPYRKKARTTAARAAAGWGFTWCGSFWTARGELPDRKHRTRRSGSRLF